MNPSLFTDHQWTVMGSCYTFIIMWYLVMFTLSYHHKNVQAPTLQGSWAAGDYKHVCFATRAKKHKKCCFLSLFVYFWPGGKTDVLIIIPSSPWQGCIFAGEIIDLLTETHYWDYNYVAVLLLFIWSRTIKLSNADRYLYLSWLECSVSDNPINWWLVRRL